MELITQSEFSRRVDVKRSTISKLIKNGKLPREQNGKLDYKKCLKIYKSLNRVPGGRPRKGEKEPVDKSNTEIVKLEGELKKVKLQQEIFKSKLTELEYLERYKKTIRIEDIKDSLEQSGAAIRERLLTLPQKLSSQLNGKTAGEIKIILMDEINEIMDSFYENSGDIISG